MGSAKRCSGGCVSRGVPTKRAEKTPGPNGASGTSDIEGKAARVAASERGQRTSFNRADGTSEIEGKVARVATSELGSERVSIDRFIAECGKGPYPDMDLESGSARASLARRSLGEGGACWFRRPAETNFSLTGFRSVPNLASIISRL